MKKKLALLYFVLLAFQTSFAQLEFESTKKASQSRIGISMGIGEGSQKIELFGNNTENLSISSGGGFGIGVEYAYRLGTYFDLSASCHLNSSLLSAKTSNGEASFNRVVCQLTPALIVPLGFDNLLNLRIGGGLGLYAFGRMNIEHDQDKFQVKYKNALGLHASFLIDYRLFKNMTISAGVRTEFVNYQYYTEPPTGLDIFAQMKTPNGSGMYLVCSYYYHF